MKVLIFDFNEDYFSLFERKMRKLPEITLYFAKSIEEALFCINKYKIDCILMNHTYLDRIEYYNQIRNAGFRGHIIITIAGKKNRVKTIYYNGISGVLDKSLNGEDFREQFCNLVSIRSSICTQ